MLSVQCLCLLAAHCQESVWKEGKSDLTKRLSLACAAFSVVSMRFLLEGSHLHLG